MPWIQWVPFAHSEKLGGVPGLVGIGKFDCRFGRLGSLESQFNVPAQPRNKASLYLCTGMAVNWPDGDGFQ